MTAQSTLLQGKLIVFFHQSSDMYGSDKVLLYLVEEVKRLGGHAVVLLPDVGPLTQEFSAREIEFHTISMLKLTRSRLTPKGLFNLALELRPALIAYDQVLGSRKVDLVHSNTLAVLGGAAWARHRRIPHLWHVHEIIEHPWVVSKIFPLMLRLFADYIVCNSNATFQWLICEQPSLIKKMRVIWNGVLAPTFIDEKKVVELHQRFHPVGARLAIGLIGRINRLKGHLLLIDAVELLYKKGLGDFLIVFMGSAPPGQEYFEDQLKERIAKSLIRDRIYMQGFTKEIWPVFAALDIVCVPSTEPESFGMVAVEAMAVGKPVVASRSGGLIEVIVDGLTGLTFKPRDSEVLARTLESLLYNDKLRVEMGNAAKERFDLMFSVERMNEQFIATYLDVIGTHK